MLFLTVWDLTRSTAAEAARITNALTVTNDLQGFYDMFFQLCASDVNSFCPLRGNERFAGNDNADH